MHYGAEGSWVGPVGFHHSGGASHIMSYVKMALLGIVQYTTCATVALVLSRNSISTAFSSKSSLLSLHFCLCVLCVSVSLSLLLYLSVSVDVSVHAELCRVFFSLLILWFLYPLSLPNLFPISWLSLSLISSR